jgi:hypothetical protein
VKNYSHDKIEIILVGNKLDLKAKLFYYYKAEPLASKRRRPLPRTTALGILRSLLKVERGWMSVFCGLVKGY